MVVPENAVLIRFFLGESDHVDGRPLFETIVLKARERGLAGATVLRGPMGFGHGSHLHTAKVLRLSADLPIVIEIVDAEDRAMSFLTEIEALLESCLVTIEEVRVLRYGHNRTT